MLRIIQIWNFVKSAGFMAAVAVIGLAFAVYQTYFYEKNPQIEIRIDALSPVFDIHAPVGGLQVFYAGDDLRTKKEKLWIMSVSVTNSGSAAVRKTDYDETVPLGLRFSGAIIAEMPTFRSANSYLQENLKLAFQANQIKFSPVIFEPGDSFQVTVLLLGPEGARPLLEGAGKIAGVRVFSIVTQDSKSSDKSWWEKVTGAEEFWVQPARAIVYLFGGILSWALLASGVLLVVVPFFYFREKMERAERLSRIKAYRKDGGLEKEARYLCDQYAENGNSALRNVWGVIKEAKERRALLDSLGAIEDNNLVEQIANKLAPNRHAHSARELAKHGLFSVEGLCPTWPETLEAAVSDLAAYLNIDLDEELKSFYDSP